MFFSIILQINNILLKSKKSVISVIKIKLPNTKGLILKKGIKKVKTGKQDATYVITEYEPDGSAIMYVHT